ncbi:MAG: hypothetical protein PHD76_07245 [Methylacidiphilales bacterium]|nr:hypothetical protein [Candidatus Methylacidiphilales bacterium]
MKAGTLNYALGKEYRTTHADARYRRYLLALLASVLVALAALLGTWKSAPHHGHNSPVELISGG